MSIQDTFKKSFLTNFNTTDVSTYDIVVTLVITLLLALYIFFIYRIISRKNFYNKNFNISIAALSLITAAIIITIQSSIVVSLGMVGALSIVRFRTAVKDPLDLVFLFWAIAVGIICGAGLYNIAAIVSIIVTILIFALDMMPIAKVPMLLVIRASERDMQEDILAVVKEASKYYKVKSRNITGNRLNMIIELRTREEGRLLESICDLEGVEYASLLDHDGEVTY